VIAPAGLARALTSPTPALALTSASPLAIDLSASQQALVRRLIDGVLPGARVAVFGSRATGRARPYSDLDLLLLEPACLTWAQGADLRDVFEARELPFRVDLVDADGLAEGMMQRVKGEARLLP